MMLPEPIDGHPCCYGTEYGEDTQYTTESTRRATECSEGIQGPERSAGGRGQFTRSRQTPTTATVGW
jgi:hypothetical protein